MVNLHELFEVTPTITRVEIGARNSTGKLARIVTGSTCRRDIFRCGLKTWYPYPMQRSMSITIRRRMASRK